MGWVTKYFTDVEKFSWIDKKNGKHVCQVPDASGKLCNHQVNNNGCCDDGMCWCPYSSGPSAMQEHLISAHRIAPPLTRQWASELCDTQGCLDTIFCAPCQGSRQMMAMSGYADTFHAGWCCLFCLAGCRSKGKDETY